MALNFQQPGFVPVAQTRDIGPTLDSVFDMYMKGRLANVQEGLQRLQLQSAQRQGAVNDLQDVSQFGAPLTQFSPDDLMRANAPTPTAQVPAMLARPGLPASAPDASGMVTMQGNEDPRIGHLRSGLDALRSQRAAQMAEAQAQLGKTQAETRGANAKAGLDEFNANLLGAGRPGMPAMPGAAGPGGAVPYPQGQGALAGSPAPQNLVQQVASEVAAGRIAPNQADDYLGRNPLAHLAYVRELSSRGLDVAKLQLDFDRNKATASFEGGEGAQKPARLMRSLLPSLDYLDQLSKEVSPDNLKIINKYGIKLAAEKGDAKAQELMSVSQAIADEFQAMIGGGSNAKLELGLNLFDTAKTPEQIARTTNFVRQNLANRADALLGKETMKPVKTLEEQRAGAAGGGKGPRVGEVDGGYRFKGGDPSKPESWEKS